MTKFSKILPRDIATAMGLDDAAVWMVAAQVEQDYLPERMVQIGKKLRPLDVPKKRLMKQLRKLHKYFQELGVAHKHAYGGVKGQSCFTHASRHLGRGSIWTRDASNCYPSVSPEALKGELRKLGFRSDTARLLSQLLTVRGRIPQGSSPSGDALNLFLWRYDQTMASICGLHKLRFGRFADDTVSSGKNQPAGFTAARIAEAEFMSRGLQVNLKKKREQGFQSNSEIQYVHNIVVNSPNGTRSAEEHWKSAQIIADAYVKGCASIHSSSIEAVANKRGRLTGMIYYHRQAKFSPAKHLYQLLRRGDRLVAQKLKELHISPKNGKWWLKTKTRNEPRKTAALMLRREMGHFPENRLPRRRRTVLLTDDEIAVAAYYLWEKGGRVHGHDQEHWLAARKKLIGQRKQDRRLERQVRWARPKPKMQRIENFDSEIEVVTGTEVAPF